MAQSINHEEVHNLLVTVARQAGDIIVRAVPHVQTSDTKKNSKAPIPFYIFYQLRLTYSVLQPRIL